MSSKPHKKGRKNVLRDDRIAEFRAVANGLAETIPELEPFFREPFPEWFVNLGTRFGRIVMPEFRKALKDGDLERMAGVSKDDAAAIQEKVAVVWFRNLRIRTLPEKAPK